MESYARSSRYGALPSQTLRELVTAGFIEHADVDNIAPSSLDLTLSGEVYCTEGMFQLNPGESVRDLLTHIHATPWSFEKPLVRGGMYLARLNETLRLPSSVYGYCNPKSSTGRIDVHVRVLADGVPRYDSVTPAGWNGELWIAIHPKSFPILLREGHSLSQLRLFTADTRFSELEFEIALSHHKLLWQRGGDAVRYDELRVSDHDGAPMLSLDLKSPLVGWVSKHTDQVLDVSTRGSYAPEDFFEQVAPENGHLTLERGKFYILSTDEAVRVPPELACEMASMDERSGDFRSHYAGFIDPGWGWGKEGEEKGRPLTLEVRPFEDLVVRHGQPIAKIKFERMTHVPDVLYDTRGSNYTTQTGPRLAKQFRTE